MAAEKTRVLVLAEHTGTSERLLDALKERAAHGPVAFMIVIPGKPHVQAVPDAAVADLEMPDVETPPELEHELEEVLERLREAGLEVEGRVGDADAVAAVADAVNFDEFDHIIVSTPPKHLSKWLKIDLAHRIEGMTDLPVEHVPAEPADEF